MDDERIVSEDLRDIRTAIGTLSALVRSQDERLARLERGVIDRSPAMNGMPTMMNVQSGSGSAPLPPPPPAYQVGVPGGQPQGMAEPAGAVFADWFRVDWPMKVGAFLILLGFGWFVSYAFMNNWIGPVGRILLGIVTGVALLAGGYRRAGTSLNQGGVLLGLGTATTLLTMFAARELYDFFTPGTAIVFMSLVVVFTAYVSVVYRSKSIAFMSLVAGGIAPLLTAGDSNFFGLFSYLFLLSAGTLWIVRLTAWRELVFASLLLVSLYSFPFIVAGASHTDRGQALLVAVAFATLYFVASLLGMLKDRVVEQSDILVVALSGFLLLGWIHSFVPVTFQSFAAVLAAVMFSVAASLVYRVTGIASPVYIYAGDAVVFFVAATAYELSGAVFLIAMALEVGMIIVGTYLAVRRAELLENLGWLMAFPVFFSFGSMGAYATLHNRNYAGSLSMGTTVGTPVLTEDFFALVTVAVVAAAIGYLYRIVKTAPNVGKGLSSARTFTILAILYGLFIVWYGAKRAIGDEDMAALVALTIYTLVGMVLYLKARLTEGKELRMYGSGLLVLVAVRLLLVEVWSMDIFGRIITFFVIGALFMSTAFLGKKKSVTTVAGLLVFVSVLVMHPAQAIKPTAPSSDSSLSAFEQVGSVTIPALKVPVVVDVPVSGSAFRNGSYAVWDETSGMFQPSMLRVTDKPVAIRAEDIIDEFPIDSFVTSSKDDPQNLVDRNTRTSVTFPVSENGNKTYTEIKLHAASPLTLTGFTLDLDDHVSLPKTVEVHTENGGATKIVLAKTGVTDRTIRFPRETSAEWTIMFEYVQPLRIMEISLLDESRSTVADKSVRFLASPGEYYAIYSGADRPSDVKVGESPNLLDDREIVHASMGVPRPNPLYAPADTDGDGVRDLLDNCVTVANSDQKDENGNGRGDVCDDYDRDGIANSKDDCPDNPNRDQIDTDGDGIGDVCDHEESRITEKYVWLPWAAMTVSGFVVAGLFVTTLRRERNKR
jgi:hypothetical protein